MAFFRHHFLSKEYPLDSYLFASAEQIFKHHGLQHFDDYACGGLFVFNQHRHARLLNEWYFLYDKNSNFHANLGEEVYLNYHIQSYGAVQWLPYKWQALWPFEIAWNHNHLYLLDNNEKNIISRCVETSLFNNYFLHFAGAWEKWAWGESTKLFKGINEDKFRKFQEYTNIKKTGVSVGQVLPKN